MDGVGETGTDVRGRLQAALGRSYALERELRGGGMARLFVAGETALGRRVAVKVLAPDVARELSADEQRVSRTRTALLVGGIAAGVLALLIAAAAAAGPGLPSY